ncbi:DUF3891 family protein [Mesobacillus foraminis]|uniref:DUF3891 family protein n=1 Tax=Mesobacillus foraminis TaxID=279826 RepID=UPI0013CF1CBA|nr:DUF3891 family protein [Mesobacillus foraminis]
MIILEREDEFLMVNQHDHAQVSGEIAQYWKDEYFIGKEKKQQVILAIHQHDRGWMDLDASPLWNVESNRPYSFDDYPVGPKIASYRKAIDEVEQMDKYAGLLCSLHFASFLEEAEDQPSRDFCSHEKYRQSFLLNELRVSNLDYRYHLKILKLCDNLSLYLCLNEPGAEKEDEHPFFRNGFPQQFPFAQHKRIHAYWENNQTISLSLSPLQTGLNVSFPFKAVTKEAIRDAGLERAYKKAPVKIRTVTIK